jgi:hypothetical protein
MWLGSSCPIRLGLGVGLTSGAIAPSDCQEERKQKGIRRSCLYVQCGKTVKDQIADLMSLNQRETFGGKSWSADWNALDAGKKIVDVHRWHTGGIAAWNGSCLWAHGPGINASQRREELMGEEVSTVYHIEVKPS